MSTTTVGCSLSDDADYDGELVPHISHVTRGKRINVVGSAHERHFSPQYDLFIGYDTVSPGNISHE